jgi:hypothetical protein
LEEDNRQLSRSKEELFEENSRLKKELDITINRMEENAHKFNIDQSELKAEMIREKNSALNTLEDNKTRLSMFKNEIKGLKQHNQELKDKLVVLERDYLDKLRIAREDEWARAAEIETQKQDVSF